MKRILALSLLFTFLAGQLNLTLAAHFCGSMKVKTTVMLGQGNLDCGMGEIMSCDIPEQNTESTACKKTNCCDNEYFSADTDDFFDATASTLKFQCFFVASFVFTYFDYSISNIEQEHFLATSPPLVHPDKQVWYQTFLI